MDNPDTSKPTPAGMPIWAPQEFGFVGLAWFERMVGTWFDLGHAHSAQAVDAARELTNATSAMMNSAVALSLVPAARADEPAAPTAE